MNEELQTQKIYVSPEVELVETKLQAVICQSNTERPTDATPGWNWN